MVAIVTKEKLSKKKENCFCFSLQDCSEEVMKELGNVKDIAYTTGKIMKLMDIKEFTEKVEQAVNENACPRHVTPIFFYNLPC